MCVCVCVCVCVRVQMCTSLYSPGYSHEYVYTRNAYDWPPISRLMIVSREAKKNQRPLGELFTRNTTKKLANTLAKPP